VYSPRKGCYQVAKFQWYTVPVWETIVIDIREYYLEEYIDKYGKHSFRTAIRSWRIAIDNTEENREKIESVIE